MQTAEKANVPISIFFDDSFPRENVLDVTAAAESWNTVSGLAVFAKPGDAPSGDLVTFFCDDTQLGAYALATSKYGDGIVSVYVREDATGRFSVLKHELGHCLRLPHSENESSVMFPIDRGQQLVAKDEVKKILLWYSKV
ncbi:MAG: matrixin family metalloprotease [Candidatus Uhrbacteria bacterium]|nr:matrixin family metalloprotease [Candidatus Uhrbacteria bacterium]